MMTTAATPPAAAIYPLRDIALSSLVNEFLFSSSSRCVFLDKKFAPPSSFPILNSFIRFWVKAK